MAALNFKTLHVLYWQNGKGLDVDAGIIRRLAESDGFQVSFSETRQPGHYGTLWGDHVATHWHNWKLNRRLLRHADRTMATDHRRPYDVAICLEHVFPAAFRIANKTVLVPNQEWFRKSNLRKAASMDAVFCKSRLAERIFSMAGARTRYTGFTTEISRARLRQDMDFSRCLHVAGRSFMKGTRVLLETWSRHPDWPKLTIVGTAGHVLPRIPENVDLIERYLSGDERQRLQASHGIHLCPSESEGYGHTIAEAMALGAVVVTTNTPPMNELIDRDRGFLVEASRREAMGLDYRHHVAVSDLEVTMRELLSSSLEERARLGREAQQSFAQGTAFFRSTFLEALNELAVASV